MELTPPQIQRYVRQLLLPEIGVAGQLRLGNTRVQLAGAGLAVETACDYLARAGVMVSGEESATGGEALRVNVRSSGGAQFALTDRGFARAPGEAPCLACLHAWLGQLRQPPMGETFAVAMAAGALAASQLLLAALGRLGSDTLGEGVGYSFFPGVSRGEVRPREGCGCGEPLGG